MEEKLPATKIVAYEQPGVVSILAHNTTPDHAYFLVTTNPSHPSKMYIHWETKMEEGEKELIFDMSSVVRISFGTTNKVISIDLSYHPTYIMRTEKEERSCQHNNNIRTIQLWCTQTVSLAMRRYLCDEVEQIKARNAKKRMRDGNEEDELRKKNSRIQELTRQHEEDQRQLEVIKAAGCTDDFERDYYNPVVFEHMRLAKEISEIKKEIKCTPGAVPVRTIGLLNPELLVRERIDDHAAYGLYQEVVMSNTFNPNNRGHVMSLYQRLPHDIVADLIRCHKEVQHYNPNGGHPDMIAWNYEEDREMTPSEMVKYMAKGLRDARDENSELHAKLKRKEEMEAEMEEKEEAMAEEAPRPQEKKNRLGCVIM